ncbi:hypothetical protein lerEdw1_018825 [Lerista edwardsae]|nr:hypothetical protein lerEdw1_018825 [Lerista edwardsae]
MVLGIPEEAWWFLNDFKLWLAEQIKMFLEDTDPESTLEVGADMRKIKFCFNHLKKLINEVKLPRNHFSESDIAGESTNSSVATEEVKKLKDLLQQRDNEINILSGCPVTYGSAAIISYHCYF